MPRPKLAQAHKKARLTPSELLAYNRNQKDGFPLQRETANLNSMFT